MKTFETEKHNIPEGATHYTNETNADYFLWVRCESDGSSWGLIKDSDIMLNAKPIPQANIEKPEEKEVEWKSGDKCIYMSDEFLFVGMIPTLDDFSCVIFSDTHGAIRATTADISKPKTKQQREERERAEAIYEMCSSADNFTEESHFWAGKFYDLGYRKKKGD